MKLAVGGLGEDGRDVEPGYAPTTISAELR